MLIVDGFIWEEGPNSFTPNAPILRLMSDIGLVDELVLADGGLPRFVYWSKELHALPSKLGEIASFKLLSCTFKI